MASRACKMEKGAQPRACCCQKMEVLILCLLSMLFCCLSRGLVFVGAFCELISLCNPGKAHLKKKKSYGGEGKTGLSPRLVCKLAYGGEE